MVVMRSSNRRSFFQGITQRPRKSCRSGMPDREERFRGMLDMVEALVGREPRVLDLACGTGSITARLLARF